MQDSITVPRMSVQINIKHAARGVSLLLLLELFIGTILAFAAPAWQSFSLVVFLTVLSAATFFVYRLIHKEDLPSWHNWYFTAVVWVSLNVFAFLISGAAVPLAITNILFTISISPLLFNRLKSTLPMLISLAATLPILLVEFLLAPPFRLNLPESFSNLQPYLVAAITTALLLYLLRQFNLFSLRQKLIISFLLLSLIPVAGIRYFYDVSFRQALTESASQSLSSVASQTADSIDSFISANLEAVAIQSRSPAFQHLLMTGVNEFNYPVALVEARELIYSLHDLQAAAGEDSYLIGLSLINREGNVILDTAVPDGRFNPELGRNYSNDSIFLNTALIGLPYASPLRVVGEMQNARIIFAHRITNTEGRPIGIFTARFNARFLQDLLVQNRDLAGPGSYGVLFDENNIYLAHAIQPDLVYHSVVPLDSRLYNDLVTTGRLPVNPESVQSINFEELNSLLDNSSRQPTFTITDITNNNTTTQVATVRLSNYPWQIAFFQPEDIFLAPVFQQTVFSVILAGVIAVFAVVVAWVASTQLAGPILRLTEAAEAVSAGNLDVRANVDVQDEVGTLSIAFNSMTRQLRQTLEGLEDLVAVRTARLEATNEVGRVASSILNRDDLIGRIVNLITDRFGYYYTAIFLVDEDGVWANLIDATGDVGMALKAQGHRLQVEGNNMVGMAIRSYTPRIAQDVGEEPQRFANPLLPETRSEIALPLVVGDHVLGALNVQSREANAFDQQVIETLQTLANQVAIAIENANLFERTQEAARSQQRLNEFATNIQRATDISGILTTTINELSGMLDTSEISIRLASEEELTHDSNGAAGSD